MAGTVLIVDDEVQLVRHLEYLLNGEGYQAIGVHDGASARSAVERHYPDVVLVDLRLPDIDGTILMTELQELHPAAGYIIITAHGSIRSAVESTRRGARDYLTKPFEPDELLVAVRNAMRDRIRDEEITILRKRPAASYTSRSGTRPTPTSCGERQHRALAWREWQWQRLFGPVHP
jgi:two-component system nitrogen regulation response regulator NtrX